MSSLFIKINNYLHMKDVFHWCSFNSETKLRPFTHVCSMKACHLKVKHALLILMF